MASFDTPILIITYKRLETTARVLESLRAVKPTRIFVANNAPNPADPADVAKVQVVRDLFDAGVDWPCTITKLYRTQHLSAKDSISGAVTWFFQEVEEGIVLEDDCLCDPSFFHYAQECLVRYRHDEKVWHISASNFQFGKRWGTDSYYFSHYNHIWGWAGWRRAWQHFDLELKQVSRAQHVHNLQRLFPRSQDRSYWLAIYDYIKSGNLDTWDYHWQFMLWHHKAVGIIPQVNLVQNLGFGADATNSVDPNLAIANLPTEPLALPLSHPANIQVATEADIATADDFFGISKSAKTAHLKVKLATMISIKQKRKLKKMIVGLKNKLK